jgi:hypothetical protein
MSTLASQKKKKKKKSAVPGEMGPPPSVTGDGVPAKKKKKKLSVVEKAAKRSARDRMASIAAKTSRRRVVKGDEAKEGLAALKKSKKKSIAAPTPPAIGEAGASVKKKKKSKKLSIVSPPGPPPAGVEASAKEKKKKKKLKKVGTIAAPKEPVPSTAGVKKKKKKKKKAGAKTALSLGGAKSKEEKRVELREARKKAEKAAAAELKAELAALAETEKAEASARKKALQAAEAEGAAQRAQARAALEAAEEADALARSAAAEAAESESEEPTEPATPERHFVPPAPYVSPSYGGPLGAVAEEGDTQDYSSSDDNEGFNIYGKPVDTSDIEVPPAVEEFYAPRFSRALNAPNPEWGDARPSVFLDQAALSPAPAPAPEPARYGGGPRLSRANEPPQWGDSRPSIFLDERVAATPALAATATADQAAMSEWVRRKTVAHDAAVAAEPAARYSAAEEAARAEAEEAEDEAERAEQALLLRAYAAPRGPISREHFVQSVLPAWSKACTCALQAAIDAGAAAGAAERAAKSRRSDDIWARNDRAREVDLDAFVERRSADRIAREEATHARFEARLAQSREAMEKAATAAELSGESTRTLIAQTVFDMGSAMLNVGITERGHNQQAPWAAQGAPVAHPKWLSSKPFQIEVYSEPALPPAPPTIGNIPSPSAPSPVRSPVRAIADRMDTGLNFGASKAAADYFSRDRPPIATAYTPLVHSFGGGSPGCGPACKGSGCWCMKTY